MKARLKIGKNLNYRLIAALALLSFSVTFIYPCRAVAGDYDYSKYLRTSASNASAALTGISAYASQTATNYYNAASNISTRSVTNAITNRLPTSSGIQSWISGNMNYIQNQYGGARKSLGGIYDSAVTTAGKYKKQIGSYTNLSGLGSLSSMLSGISGRIHQGMSALGAALSSSKIRNGEDSRGKVVKMGFGSGLGQVARKITGKEKNNSINKDETAEKKGILGRVVGMFTGPTSRKGLENKGEGSLGLGVGKVVRGARKEAHNINRNVNNLFSDGTNPDPEKGKEQAAREAAALQAGAPRTRKNVAEKALYYITTSSSYQAASATLNGAYNTAAGSYQAVSETLNGAYNAASATSDAAQKSLSPLTNTVSLLYGLQKHYEGVGRKTVNQAAKQAYNALINYNNPNYNQAGKVAKTSADMIPNFRANSQQVAYDAKRTWDEEKGEWDYDLNVVETSRGVNTKTNEMERWRGTYQQGEGRNYVIEKLKYVPEDTAPKKQLSAVNVVQGVQQPLFTPSHHKEPLAVINPKQDKMLNDTNAVPTKAKNPGPSAALNDSAPVQQTNVSAEGKKKVSILNNPDGEGKFSVNKDVQLNAYNRVVSNQTEGSLTVMKGDNNGRIYWEKQNHNGQGEKTVIAESVDKKDHSTRSAVLKNTEGFAFYQEFNGTSSETKNPDGSAFSDTTKREKYDDFLNRTTSRLGNTTMVKLYDGQEFNVQSVVFGKPSLGQDVPAEGNVNLKKKIIVTKEGKKAVVNNPFADSARTSVPSYSEQLSGVIAVSADGKNSFFIPNNLISKGVVVTNDGKKEEYDYVVPRTIPVSNADNKEELTSKKPATSIERKPTKIDRSWLVVTVSSKGVVSEKKSDPLPPGNVLELSKIRNNRNPDKNFDVNDKYQILAGSRSAVVDKEKNTVTSMRVNPTTKEVYWITENRGQGNNATKEIVKGPVYKESSRSAMQKSQEGFAFYVETAGGVVERKNPDGTPYSNTKNRVTYQSYEDQITANLYDTAKVVLNDGKQFDVVSVVLNKPVLDSEGNMSEYYPEKLNGVVTTGGFFIPNTLISSGITYDNKNYDYILPRTISIPGER